MSQPEKDLEKDLDEDIELSDAPPIGEDKNDSAPEDDSATEEDTKLGPKATSNGTLKPAAEETPAEKKSNLENMFDDDDGHEMDEYGLSDEIDWESAIEWRETAIEYDNSRMRCFMSIWSYLKSSTD